MYSGSRSKTDQVMDVTEIIDYLFQNLIVKK